MSFSGFNETFATKLETIEALTEMLRDNLSLSNLISLDEAEFTEALELLINDLSNFKRSNEIDQDFVR